MYKSFSFIFILFLIISCNKKNKADNKFDNIIDNVRIDNKKIKINNKKNIVDCESIIENKFKLSEIIDTFEILSIKDKGDLLIADIDKIIFNDSIIFILDQFNSKIIKSCSKQTGEIITTFSKHREVPEE